MSGLVYMASPYSSTDPAIKQARYEAALDAVAKLMNEGVMAYSPIAHTHPIAIRHELPGDWEYWQAYDELMVSRCDRVVVLMLDGWEDSKGIQAEVAIAIRLNKPVTYMEAK